MTVLSWLQAYWYNHLYQVEKEFECLISMGSYDQAHALFFLKIIPSAAMTAANFILEPILTQLSQSDLPRHQHSIMHWPLGGGLLFGIQESAPHTLPHPTTLE